MEDDIFVLDNFKRMNKKIMLLGIVGAVCVCYLTRKINKQSEEIKKLNEALNNQKGD